MTPEQDANRVLKEEAEGRRDQPANQQSRRNYRQILFEDTVVDRLLGDWASI